MNLTRFRTIGGIAGVSVLASAVLVDLATGVLFDSVTVPWAVAGLLAVLAVGICALAWPVYQYVKGKRRRVDPLRAASILALAKSCTLAGAGLFGLYLGISVVALGALQSPAAWTRLWQDLAAVLAAVLLTAAGRLAEWFCRLPPEDPKPKGRAPAGADPSPA
ncbi:MAG: DUF3180 domain-containing protein [Bifidobacteriaceae bacterium]|jgi:hypothetical protein|nr:DUF3180 domain-containing protein [Bifidobacteriaceae bacterium]